MGEIISAALCRCQNPRGGPRPLQILRASNDTTNRPVGEATVVSKGCTALCAVRAVDIVTSLQRLERKKLCGLDLNGGGCSVVLTTEMSRVTTRDLIQISNGVTLAIHPTCFVPITAAKCMHAPVLDLSVLISSNHMSCLGPSQHVLLLSPRISKTS
jgi:hypothetical protein